MLKEYANDDDVERVIEHVVSRFYGDCNIFVCFVQSSVTNDLRIERFDGRPLSVSDVLVKFIFTGSNLHTHGQEIP